MTEEALTPQRVHEVLGEVLAGNDRDGIRWEGIVGYYQLNPKKAEERRAEIEQMLGKLNETFFDNGGGGWSFLNLCEDRDGRLWTGEHRTCEQLLALGAALDLVAFPLPREMWGVLPGSMPYVTVKRSEFSGAPQ